MKTYRITEMAATLLVLALLTGSLTACQTMKDHKIASGAVIGAATGAAAGALIDDDKRGRGALIGAAAGGALGAGAGWWLDRRANKLREIEDVEVITYEPPAEPVPGEVVEEPRITVRMNNEVLFDKDSSSLRSSGQVKIAEIAAVLREDPDTRVLVQGFSSSEGQEEYNLRLSERRAQAVANELIRNRIDSQRITSIGMGISNPIASNDTESGRAMNRRVEIDVFPSDDIK